MNNPIRYAGYQYDNETDLYYLNARYYDSKIARFLSEDTYAGDLNDPLSLNLYTYCLNNPISYFDPTGYLTEIAENAMKLFTDIINNPNSSQLQIESAKQNIQNVLDNDAAGRLSNSNKASDLPVIRDVAEANNVDMSVAESMIENDIFWEQNQYHTVDAMYPMVRKGTGDIASSANNYLYTDVLLASTSNNNFFDPIKSIWKKIKNWWNNAPTYEETLRANYGTEDDNSFADDLYLLLPKTVQSKIDIWKANNKELLKTDPNKYQTRYANEVLNFYDATTIEHEEMFIAIDKAIDSGNVINILAAGMEA